MTPKTWTIDAEHNTTERKDIGFTLTVEHYAEQPDQYAEDQRTVYYLTITAHKIVNGGLQTGYAFIDDARFHEIGDHRLTYHGMMNDLQADTRLHDAMLEAVNALEGEN